MTSPPESTSAELDPAAVSQRGEDGEPAGAEVELPSVGEMIRHLFKIQEKRSHIYNFMQRSFAELLASRDETAYDAKCRLYTAEFSDFSLEIRRLEAALKSSDGGAPVAALFDKLQEHEKVKLEMTCTLQVLKKALSACSWQWQQEEEEAATETLRSSLSDAPPPPPPDSVDAPPRGRAVKAAWGRCACADANCTEGDAAEPSREEYYAAVAEATQMLESSVNDANDVLEELRYELEEQE
mmetsp:Transcript_8180/g.14166  ORF Transcript_8180/g.14166 Transcript_8180/m.14166 type:complete len:240 (+) Transcript_8180:146-865(+)|eukprot:CAMPEP_0198204920 /NCGR_PEP_ID=MMETSP1445-20131203/8401_1 /TAXON_ID=36898 /ORGANISM="Pyramimonas sp., Strain CCMP2087" /LENGTH=239 /DNA_ID=CAMNT_0043877015 /DNA_START=130 /DNA_END=849 /DNA_ORIENTATION=-